MWPALVIGLLLVPVAVPVILTICWRKSLLHPWQFLVVALIVSCAFYTVVGEIIDFAREAYIFSVEDKAVQQARIAQVGGFWVRRGFAAAAVILLGTPLLWWISGVFMRSDDAKQAA
jgi:hypothetical protein